MALGLGRVSTLSTLGSPLEFSVALAAQASDSVSPDCVRADVYSGDTRVPDEMVRVRVNRSGDGTPVSLRIQTGTRVDEPVASVELTLDCGVRVARKYVVFVDPPSLNLAQASPEGAATASPVAPRAEPRSRDLAPSATNRRARAPKAGSGTVQVGGTGTATTQRQRRSDAVAAASQARAKAPAPESGSRLQLESARPSTPAGPMRERSAIAAAAAASTALAASASKAVAAASAALGSSAVAGAAAAVSSAASATGLLSELAAKAEADAAALNAERLRELEAGMKRMRADNLAMQQSMRDLQQRLREAESTRYANPLVYGLVAALVLLLAAVIALLWRQSAMRRESDWLKAAASENADAPNEAADRPSEPRLPVRPSVPPPPIQPRAATALLGSKSGDPDAPNLTATAGDGGGVVDFDLPDAPPASPARPSAEPAMTPHEATSVHQVRREVTVEELIDLEQQADFFVVLGQDDAAIDLLMGHVQGTGGASPLPYLKLLELHRRRDEQAAYDLVRERFNRRFGAFAPEWDDQSGHDRSLEDYPAVVERLQRLWPTPTPAMDALSALLFQREPLAQTFDLPAYGELLFLYSLARELAESEPPADGVDLLLPLDDGAQAAKGPGHTAAMASAGGLLVGGAAVAAAENGLDFDPQDLPRPIPTSGPGGAGGSAGNAGMAAPQESPDAVDFGLLDLTISDDPEEPKGPLSKY